MARCAWWPMTALIDKSLYWIRPLRGCICRLWYGAYSTITRPMRCCWYLPPIITIVMGGIVKIVIDLTLVGNPNIGIFGAAIGTLTCDVLISMLNLLLIKAAVKKAPSYAKIFVKPVICSAFMGASAYLSYALLSKLFTGIFGSSRVWVATAAAMIGAVVIAVIVYFVAVVLTKTLTKEDMDLMPGGKKLAKILKIR